MAVAPSGGAGSGTSGGWTHVTEVACGLHSLGHNVLVVARAPSDGTRPKRLDCGVPLVLSRLRPQLAFLGLPQVRRIAVRFRPDVIMERFYNFAGAGVSVARWLGNPALLEVNAPMVDPPGSLKTKVDTLLLGSLRRWAVRQALWSAAIVTPLNTTVPAEVNRRKIHELPWGANVDHFNPGLRTGDTASRLRLAREIGLSPGYPVAAFVGSFRSWHGARYFAEAARKLLEGGAPVSFLAIGDGPELPGLRSEASSWSVPEGRLVFTGAQPHTRIPDLLSLADIGVAPFDVESYEPLKVFGFYWSPLKVFEYMAMALPVVTVDVPPLNNIVREGKEGILFKSGDRAGLEFALLTLIRDEALRRELGANARTRVAERYSWEAHCAALDRLLEGLASSGG